MCHGTLSTFDVVSSVQLSKSDEIALCVNLNVVKIAGLGDTF